MARDVVLTLARVSRRPGQASLFEHSLREELLDAISTRTIVTRYNRTWRFSRPREIDPVLLAGRLGFERLREAEETGYDEAIEDFTTQLRVSEQGRFSHYVVDLESRYLLFEERPPDIRRQSFVGAFKDLVRANDSTLDLELVTRQRTFEDWLQSVDRLQRFRATLLPPNPEWTDDVEEIRRIIEETGAASGAIDLRATAGADGPSLQVEGTVIIQAVKHAENANASYVAEGTSRGVRQVFRSSDAAQTSVLHEDDDDESDQIWDQIARILKDIST